MSKRQQQFKTLKNSIERDEEIRAVLFPTAYKHLVKSDLLGMGNWSLLARLSKQAFLRAVRSVEKTNVLDKSMDSMGRLGAINPNIQNDGAIDWDEDLDDGVVGL